MKIYVSRFIEGISLNQREYLLDKPNGKRMVFASLRDAYDFLLASGFKRKDIGYSVFIGTLENYDMVTERIKE